MMIHEQYPKNPFLNPPIPDGDHRATLDEIVFTTYGEYDEPMLRILFDIPSLGVPFVEHLHFPRNGTGRSRQRLWWLFRAVGVELWDAEEQAREVEGKQLLIEVRRVESDDGKGSHHEIASFNPLYRPQPDDGWDAEQGEHAIRASWIQPLSASSAAEDCDE